MGAGLGGVPMALELRKHLRGEDRVTVVSDLATFNFTPSNPWVAVSWRIPDQIRVPLAEMFRKKNIDFIHAAVTAVEPKQNRLTLADGAVVPYDYLVIATGPDLAFDEIPGLGPDGHTQSICRLDHAERTAEAWGEFLEAPGPIIVGAAQGASCFGPAYEYAFILDTVLRKKKLRDRAPITYVTSEPYIGHLGLDGVGDTKGLLESEMRDRGINWITSSRITGVGPGKMQVEEVGRDGAVVKAHELPFAHAMILPAFRGVKPLMGVEGLVNPRGFVLADKTQQNPNFPNVFSVGVCVAIPPVATYPVPVGVPKTGFMIESMVRAAARNIRSLIDEDPVRARPPGTRSVWPTLAIAASPSWPCRRFPRAT